MSWAQVLKQRSAILYTMGVWTVFGSIFYYTSSYIKEEEPPVMPEGKDKRTVISEDGLKETVIYRKPGSSFYTVTTTEYEPNFVPYHIRLHNYIQSFFDDGGSKGK